MSGQAERLLRGPEVWSGPALSERTDWIAHLESSEVAEIDAMLAAHRGSTTALTELLASL